MGDILAILEYAQCVGHKPLIMVITASVEYSQMCMTTDLSPQGQMSEVNCHSVLCTVVCKIRLKSKLH